MQTIAYHTQRARRIVRQKKKQVHIRIRRETVRRHCVAFMVRYGQQVILKRQKMRFKTDIARRDAEHQQKIKSSQQAMSSPTRAPALVAAQKIFKSRKVAKRNVALEKRGRLANEHRQKSVVEEQQESVLKRVRHYFLDAHA